MQTFSYPDKGSRVLREWNEMRTAQKAMQTGGRSGIGKRNFSAAAIDRLTASMATWSGAVNADLDSALIPLRSRARSLCANNEYGRRFLTLVANNIVGSCGPTLQVRAQMATGKLDTIANAAVETAYARWSLTADLGGRMSLSRLFQVLIKGVARDGEAIVRFVRDRSMPCGMALQLLEPDRLYETLNQRLPNGGMIRQGVELDPLGRPIAYHLLAHHPGENYAAGAVQIERVPARDILHIFLPERAEQVRGYTWLHAVLILAQMMHGYKEAAVVAARVGASKMGVWTKSDETASALETLADSKDAAGNLAMSAEPGEFIEAPPGYTLESWNPDYPHQNFESFMNTCLRGLATGVDVATHNLTGDMTGVNYSSARIAELAERDCWMVLQEWFIDSVCQRIKREWMVTALLRGDIVFPQSGKSLPADKFDKFDQASGFQARRWEWVDPLKEVTAATDKVALGVTSRTRIAAAQGQDFEDIVNEQRQEKDMLVAAGLWVKPPDAPVKNAAAIAAAADAAVQENA